MHFSTDKKLSAPPSEIIEISERLEKVLRAVGAARARRQLTVEEAFIFLAIGFLGISNSRSGVAITVVSCIDIAEVLKIPRETVRRKVVNLVEMQLVSMTTRGMILEAVDEWRALAAEILQYKSY
ncbi:MAG: hypothetical protein ACLPIC_00860 [Rhodoblastus sp.]|uniref:hypothetical protein n=1 Tax=Rhodoblastus sp. TaxID=1962975 RepID=UPI003F95D5D0